jgi:hypothetical protein
MRIQSQYRPPSLRALLGLVGLVFVLTVVGAEPLHLLEGRDTGVSVVLGGGDDVSSPVIDAAPADPPAGENPFTPDHGDCLSCMALALAPQASSAPSLFLAAPPAAPSVAPSPGFPAERTEDTDARPRAPPTA